jgi:hypothetical protein
MIEDMYKEEISEEGLDSNSDNVQRNKDKPPSSEEKEDHKTSMSQVCQTSQLGESKANIGGVMSFGGAPAGGFHNDANPDDSFMSLMLKAQRPRETDGSGLLHDVITHHSDESAVHGVPPDRVWEVWEQQRLTDSRVAACREHPAGLPRRQRP